MFIARISRGRTIRQFVAGVLLIPSVVSLVWFAIFGGAAINLQRNGTDLAGAAPTEGQLFGMLDTLPLGAVLEHHRDAPGGDLLRLRRRRRVDRDGHALPARHDPARAAASWSSGASAMGAVARGHAVVGRRQGDALAGIQNITIIMAAPFVARDGR